MTERKFKFKSGDIVKLKSGGPSMTVQEWDKLNESYRCKWFAGNKVQTGHFEEDSLVPVEEEGTGKK